MPLSADQTTAVVGGTVVSPGGAARGDVLIEDGRIAAVGEVDASGARVIDASGCLVLPGAIDVHTHVFGGIAGDTRSALIGGTTSALAFVDAEPGETPAQAARRTLADEMPQSLIDLAFHAVIWEPQSYRRGDLRDAAELGVGSVKLWLAYIELGIMADDDVAFAVMQEAAELGMVMLAHCENGRVIDVLTSQLVERGELGLDSLPRSRPIELEAECMHRFLVMAELAGGTRLRRAHVPAASRSRRSRPPAAAACRARRGVHRTTCCSTSPTTAAPDGLRYVMTPPLRTADDRGGAARRPCATAPWTRIASDHCHLRLDPRQAAAGRRLHAGADRAARHRRPAADRLRGGRRSAAGGRAAGGGRPVRRPPASSACIRARA